MERLRQFGRKVRSQFAFDGLDNSAFTENIWCPQYNGFFFFYRFIVTAYWFGMWLYRIITFPELGEIYTDFLTNWTDTMICFFYTSTFIVMCLARYSDRFQPNNKANWFLYCVQINYEICLSAAVLVVASVWISAIINSTLEDDYGDSTWAFKPSNMPLLIQNLHGHIFELVFIFIDLCVNSIPVRWGHVVHIWLYGIAYALATYIIFTIDVERDEVYPILNWRDGVFMLDKEPFPINTVGLFAIFIFIFSTIFHMSFYGLSRVKFRISSAKKTLTPPQSITQKDNCVTTC